MLDTNGHVTVIVGGAQSDGASHVNGVLPEGTIVSTGEDGEAIIELLPGIVIKMMAKTQITIGEVAYGDARDPLGNILPMANITLSVGTIVAVLSDTGLLTGGLNVITPRGTVTPMSAGETVITVTGTDPRTSTVTVSSVAGSSVVTKGTGFQQFFYDGKSVADSDPSSRQTTSDPEGERILVPEGLAVILTPDGEHSLLPIADLPNGAWITGIAKDAASQISNLPNTTPAVPPPVLPAWGPGIPPNQPPKVPGKGTPTPAPISL